MKSSSKVLLLSALMLFLFVTYTRVKFDGIVETVPLAGKLGRIEKYFEYDNLTALELNGEYDVTINRDEKNCLKITGPDLLIDYYTNLVAKEGKVSISPKVDLSKYGRVVKINIGIRELKNIKIMSGCAVLINSLSDGKNISVYTANNSIAVFANCNYENVYVEAKDKSKVLFSKAKNYDVKLSDMAGLFIRTEDGILKGITPKGTDFGFEGNVKYNYIQQIDTTVKGGVK